MTILKPKLTKFDLRTEKLKKELEPGYRPRRKLNVWIDGNLFYQFKKKCAENEVAMTDLITAWMKDYLLTK